MTTANSGTSGSKRKFEFTDAEFTCLCDAAVDIRYRLMKDGGAATQVEVENILILEFKLTSESAREIANIAKTRREFITKGGQTFWVSDRPEPGLNIFCDYSPGIIITNINTLPELFYL